MTENLRLTGKIALSPNNSDVSAVWTLPAANTSFPTSCVNTAYNMNSGNASYGNYYNWYAATAGTGTCSMSSGNAGSSICPRGWKLPTGGGSGQFQTLYDQYPSASGFLIVPLNFVLSGVRNSNNTYYQGSSGLYWSSTVYSSERGYSLTFGNSSAYPQDTIIKSLGLTVRCIAQ